MVGELANRSAAAEPRADGVPVQDFLDVRSPQVPVIELYFEAGGGIKGKKVAVDSECIGEDLES